MRKKLRGRGYRGGGKEWGIEIGMGWGLPLQKASILLLTHVTIASYHHGCFI